MSKRRSTSQSRDPDYQPPTNTRQPAAIPPPTTPPPSAQSQPTVRTTTTTTPTLIVRGKGNFATSPGITLSAPAAQNVAPGTMTWALVTPVGAPRIFEPFADYMARVKKTPTRKYFFSLKFQIFKNIDI